MSAVKAKGSKICTRAYIEGKLDYSEYSAVMDAISEIDTLADRDVELRGLWESFGDIPMNPKTEEMEAPFLHFNSGTPREDIWRWFDERYSKGVYALLYGEDDCSYEQEKA